MGIDRRGLDAEALTVGGAGMLVGFVCVTGVGTVACICVAGGALLIAGGIAWTQYEGGPLILYNEGDEETGGPPGIAPRPDLPPLGGGRIGENVKGLKGPPNSAIPGTGGRIYVTDGQGNVTVDVTPDRAKDVTPGVGFGGKRPPTQEELDLWNKLKGSK